MLTSLYYPPNTFLCFFKNCSFKIGLKISSIYNRLRSSILSQQYTETTLQQNQKKKFSSIFTDKNIKPIWRANFIDQFFDK